MHHGPAAAVTWSRSYQCHAQHCVNYGLLMSQQMATGIGSDTKLSIGIPTDTDENRLIPDTSIGLTLLSTLEVSETQ